MRAARVTLCGLAAAVSVSLVACGGCEPTGDREAGPPLAEGSVSATASAAPTESASAAPPPPPAPPLYDVPLPDEDVLATTMDEQREAMLRRMVVVLGIDDETTEKLRTILGSNKAIGQGNPDVTKHPMTRKECRERRKEAGVVDEEHARCGGPMMVPVYDPETETPGAARVCIDRYEFPNVPCDYPVTWVSAKNAQLLCNAMGKRLCDAHEWEGACAGKLRAVEDEYHFGFPRKEQKNRHNNKREIRWAYGEDKDHTKCGTGSKKTDECTIKGVGYKRCGSNTYPVGAFPECKSPFGVYDQHGNAAEHMNLPLKPDELASVGDKLGETEMKGSWFIFQGYEAHADDCRWRAPDWHGSKLMIDNSHANYHLGFRCCKDVGEPAAHGDGGAGTGEAEPKGQ